MTISRLPSEAGVVWRLTLPHGERVEAWEPGNAGLSLPAEILRLVSGVVGGKGLIPSAPVSSDGGAARLRQMLETQRRALLVHDPGVRLGSSPENVRRHRVAARRSRTFLRATRAYVDPNWRRSLAQPLSRLSETTGPARDLDVLLDHLAAGTGAARRSGSARRCQPAGNSRQTPRRGPAAAAGGAGRGVVPAAACAAPSSPAPSRRRGVDPTRANRATRVSRAREDDQAPRQGHRRTANCTNCGSRSNGRATPPNCPLRPEPRPTCSSRLRRRCRACSASTRTPPWQSRSFVKLRSSTSRRPRRSSRAGSPSGSRRAWHARRIRFRRRGGGCGSAAHACIAADPAAPVGATVTPWSRSSSPSDTQAAMPTPASRRSRTRASRRSNWSATN